jgi:protocatechuate 3,4-dioxygenase beta subunit
LRDGGLLSDAGTDAAICRASERDALGPFFEDGSPTRALIAALDEPGDRLFIEGSLVDVADCARPLSGYVVDVWQADVDGAYHAANSSDFRLRGRVVTGADGRFAFETIKPGFYETAGGPRPAHLHVRVYTADGVDRLVTQLYFAGDEFLGLADGCQPPTCFSGDPDRILDLAPTRVSGRDGLLGRVRLVVPA